MSAPIPNAPERPVKFWDCFDDREQLGGHSEIADAVEEWLDLWEGPVPAHVTVFGYAPMRLPSALSIADDVLEHVLERLDEEYGDPDGNSTKPSAAMKSAALAFADAMLAAYDVYMCEQVTHQVVRVADYAAVADDVVSGRETV